MKLSMDLWRLNNMNVILLFLNTELLIVFLSLALAPSAMFTIKPTNLKKSYFGISKKRDQPSINLANVFNFIG